MKKCILFLFLALWFIEGYNQSITVGQYTDIGYEGSSSYNYDVIYYPNTGNYAMVITMLSGDKGYLFARKNSELEYFKEILEKALELFNSSADNELSMVKDIGHCTTLDKWYYSYYNYWATQNKTDVYFTFVKPDKKGIYSRLIISVPYLRDEENPYKVFQSHSSITLDRTQTNSLLSLLNKTNAD